jgi:hypothetical protein
VILKYHTASLINIINSAIADAVQQNMASDLHAGLCSRLGSCLEVIECRPSPLVFSTTYLIEGDYKSRSIQQMLGHEDLETIKMAQNGLAF